MTSVNTLVLSTDRRYAPAAAVAVRSALDAYQGAVPLEVVVLCYDTDGAAQDLIKQSFAGEAVIVMSPDRTDIEDLPERSYFGNDAVYARLMLDRLLPGRHRVVYLDADTLTVGDISYLWRMPLAGRPVAAAREMFSPTVDHPNGLWNFAESGIPAGTAYLNSGVLVIDLLAWKARGFTDACLAYLRRHADLVRYPDQDALNAVLEGEWIELDPAYNCTIFWDRPKSDVSAYGDVRGRARIWHFLGVHKPWRTDYPFPDRQALYRAALDRTMFRQVSQ